MSILKELQDFGLQAQIQIRDLIKKQSSSVRHLHVTRLGRMGIRKRSLLVTEQFTLEKSSRDCGTVHFYKRARGHCRVEVNVLREQPLSCSVLALNQDRHIGCQHLVHFLPNRSHGRGTAKDNFLRRQPTRSRSQSTVCVIGNGHVDPFVFQVGTSLLSSLHTKNQTWTLCPPGDED